MSFVICLPLDCREILYRLAGIFLAFFFLSIFGSCMRRVINNFIFVVRSRTTASLYTQAGLHFFSENFLAYLVHLHKHCLF
jgi:hypothetical protein